MTNNKLNLLGLAYRAKKISIGSDLTIEAIKKNNCFLVFFDKDYSSSTEKQIKKLCDINKIPYITEFTKDELSHAIGKAANIRVIGIIDKGFGDSIVKCA